MSFWSGLKEFGAASLNNMAEKSQRMQEYKDRYESLSKEELMHELHRTHNDEKIIAIRSICRDRGYID